MKISITVGRKSILNLELDLTKQGTDGDPDSYSVTDVRTGATIAWVQHTAGEPLALLAEQAVVAGARWATPPPVNVYRPTI